MSGLAKATLAEVEVPQRGAATVRDEMEVQFNPSSLRLTLQNENEGGQSRGRQARQFTGRSSTELSFDLIFDTADEVAEDGSVRSVRERTAMVERFLVPTGNDDQKQAPPMVRFQWGHLVLDGMMSSLSIDFELFSPDGVPLRATMSVSIEEQDPRYTYLEEGPGANRPSDGGGSEDTANASGAAGTGGGGGEDGGGGRPGEPGTSGGGSQDRAAPALEGESAADFAARQGLDPARWRALAREVDDPLSLPAGADIGFDPSLSAGLGAGIRAGFQVGAEASLEASLGLEAGADGRLRAGRTLARSGGVSAALDTARRARAETAARASLRAFDSPEAGAPAGPAPVPPSDLRAVTYGLGVPLRPRAAGPAAGGPGPADGGRASVVPDGRPGQSPWTRLPAGDRARRQADREQERRRADPCRPAHAPPHEEGC